ncbi:hypothetical protein CE340_15570 [Salmonella enterica subsp. enterica serovar Newport]|uniref:Uncharacterized protein n=8 Tax=Salmonella enterica TaxID=28901 RepID=A0A602YDL0_SALMU|nr:hypothetical protein [Salmonella enterica]ECT9288151.1 hypothetical protein [Salmonella enterica subsp. enterica serovar Thompson]EDB4091932.1 hypothetical protein [Salmonella enterica subsp. enterica serovar Typhimurium]EDT1288410.1 hypothetical protein [Salmonella enterica subsp. enterica serovar Manhattan]EDV8905598.1 hypothetical protein [Salmonella enterica subsp. enterica serovar Javiana]EDW8352711.1 hypothetical protein [Salmonella enterica subsp. enterica serovar 6,8:-:1,2]EDX32925
MIKEGIILKAEILSEYIYILKLIWLLTENNLLSNQMKEGSTKEQLIDELKEAVKKQRYQNSYQTLATMNLLNPSFSLLSKESMNAASCKSNNTFQNHSLI